MKIEKTIPLAQFTTYKIGGPAKYFAAAKDEHDLRRALKFARDNHLKYFILGGGSNVLASSVGYDGLIINIADKRYSIKHQTITASAGNDMQKLVDISIDHSLKGLQWAGGLPGQLGGAIRGNAGAFGGEIKDIVKNVWAMDNRGNIKKFTKKQCKFGYRTSIFKQNPALIILAAQLKFKKHDNRAQLRATADEKINWRKTKHPMQFGNCGSVFKRKPLKEISQEVAQKHPHMQRAVRDNQVATAFFIDEAGLKNIRIGGAEVSDRHPNFIVNATGNATSEDVKMVASMVKSRVVNKFGVFLEEEIHYLE